MTNAIESLGEIESIHVDIWITLDVIVGGVNKAAVVEAALCCKTN